MGPNAEAALSVLWRTKREPERKLGCFILKPFVLDLGVLATL